MCAGLKKQSSTFRKNHIKEEYIVDLDELISSIDIVEFLSQYTDLEEKNGEWWGLSPLKDEKTPSFSVRQNPPVFYDYSSGTGGSVLTFVKFYHKCSGREAVEILKRYAGYGGDLSSPRKKLFATATCKKYAKPRSSKKESASKILPDDFMNRYEKRWDKLRIWENEGISKESLNRFQVYYDSFSNRLVYPIRNVSGKIVNIGGRTLDPQWKEKGQRKYCYFYSWGTMDTIYGLAENMKYILERKEIILFEGCKSVLVADSWGVKNGACLLTSHLNPHQMKILARLGCRVVFALDKDVDIRKDHNIEKLRRYVNVEYLFDKDDSLEAKDAPVDKGLEVFRRLYNERRKYR